MFKKFGILGALSEFFFGRTGALKFGTIGVHPVRATYVLPYVQHAHENRFLLLLLLFLSLIRMWNYKLIAEVKKMAAQLLAPVQVLVAMAFLPTRRVQEQD